MVDAMTIKAYKMLLESDLLGKLHRDCIDAFIALGGRAAPFEIQAWWEKWRSPVGWKPGGQPAMQPRVTELYKSNYLVKMLIPTTDPRTHQSVNVYELVAEPPNLPIGWNKKVGTAKRIKELEDQLANVEGELLSWCHSAGWATGHGDTPADIAREMMSQHCDERSYADLTGDGGLPEARAARAGEGRNE